MTEPPSINVQISPDFVTRQELNGKLDRLPSRWEVRFLVLAGMIASQVVPSAEYAQAAVRAVFQ